jgi:MbtH protein
MELKMNTFKVVINAEEQYSIWPISKINPKGWKDCHISGSQKDCLDYIEKVWKDISPKSAKYGILSDYS